MLLVQWVDLEMETERALKRKELPPVKIESHL